MRIVPTCPTVPRGHICPLCESDCDGVTRLKRLVCELEQDVMRLAYALVEERGLRDFAEREIEARFPRERAA